MESIKRELDRARERFRLTQSEADAKECERLYYELKELEKENTPYEFTKKHAAGPANST